MEDLLVEAQRCSVSVGVSGIVGTEHMLMALLSDEYGVAGQVLRELGVAEAVRTRLDEIMRSEGYRTPAPHPDALG
jgi:hypothetical protein